VKEGTLLGVNHNILVITTVYRVGEKIYPIIPLLAQHANVDVLNLYQMSCNSPWIGTSDPRTALYDICQKCCNRVIHGPAACKGGDNMAKIYDPFAKKLDKILSPPYNAMLIDNNIPTKGGATADIYQWLKKQGAAVIAAPHSNRDFKGYKVLKRMSNYFDYSFVLGDKDIKNIIKTEKGDKKQKKRLIPAGIPSNDKLKDYKHNGKYILVITNITDPKQIQGPVKHLKPFTKAEVDALKLTKLAEEFNCDVVIKLKNKMFYQTDHFEDSLKGYEGLKFITDCDDDNKLIANAKFVISHPSTMAFKPVQLGVPTFLLGRYGMVGNFYDFPDLIECDYKSLKKAMEKDNTSKYKDFIRETLTGGIDFTSSQIYIKNILERCS
tara:strand:- start:5453 stop:6595 length:1143 start_codon:yes stop_codon:yes gene_type:complete